MLNPTELAAIGGIVAGLFGAIHHLQNRRLNKVEEEKVAKETCKVRHNALDEKLDDIKGMVEFLHNDRIKWLEENGKLQE